MLSSPIILKLPPQLKTIEISASNAIDRKRLVLCHPREVLLEIGTVE